MIELELLVVDGEAGSSRVIFQKAKYYPRSFNPGLESALTKAFRSFLREGVSRMELKTTLVPEAHSLDHLVTISDETLAWIGSDARSFDGLKQLNGVYVEFLESLSPVISLLSWHFASNKERFHPGSLRALRAVSRVCILCKDTQVRNRNAQELHKPSGEESGWPLGCLNPNCLSHKIEEEIDPDYQIPVEEDTASDLSSLGLAIRKAATRVR
ncbi:MAG: hypothetical protein AAB552_00475 [Patescibacteria group bacterium]